MRDEMRSRAALIKSMLSINLRLPNSLPLDHWGTTHNDLILPWCLTRNSSLRTFCVFCVSAVRIERPFFNRRDAENAKGAQRRAIKHSPESGSRLKSSQTLQRNSR